MVEANIVAIKEELMQLNTTPTSLPKLHKSLDDSPLPMDLPRTVIEHEPESTISGCRSTMKRIDEDMADKLDYVPGVFKVEHQVRDKWVCGYANWLRMP